MISSKPFCLLFILVCLFFSACVTTRDYQKLNEVELKADFLEKYRKIDAAASRVKNMEPNLQQTKPGARLGEALGVLFMLGIEKKILDGNVRELRKIKREMDKRNITPPPYYFETLGQYLENYDHLSKPIP